MNFSDFANKLYSVISGGASKDAFTRTLFESILDDDDENEALSIVSGRKKGIMHRYFSGSSSINQLAKEINVYIEPMNFEQYIDGFSDGTVENLCEVFKDDLPEINSHNAGEKLAALFQDIIIEAAGKPRSVHGKAVIPSGGLFGSDVVSSGYYVVKASNSDHSNESITYFPEVDPFREYIDKAVDHYSMKKTLLYAESPRPFYSMYVCNDLCLHKFKLPGFKGDRSSPYRTDITASLLEKESEYNIIQGTGGIGKSMLMTHLFLSSVKGYDADGRLPVLVLLKDYKGEYPDLVTFIHKAITDFAPDIGQEMLIEKLKNGNVIVFLDGLDEIRSQLKESFDSNLENFMKCYKGNSVFLTSRPIDDFVSYSKFTVYDIEPLRKEQALELVKKLEFWDEEKKNAFIADLDIRLYHSHKQFASNPLLLTIMLMTYSSYGEIPEKMHVFYAEAYRTMARLHDRTKGSYKRPLHTGLTPEDFAIYFSQFCARTFVKELLEFTADSFSQFMIKVIKDIGKDIDSLKPLDFLKDLTDNLCIMYCEGERYYFIHRSFQEYFAALYFVNNEDVLPKVGFDFDERGGLFSRRVLEMMYEMEPERVERLLFLPYLEMMFLECTARGKGRYWGFLLRNCRTTTCIS